MATYTGHLLIGVDDPRTEGGFSTYITPATFTGNGLALHREIDGNGWVVAHVSSGAKLRGRLKLREAHKLLRALEHEDWTFHKDAVTAEHAQRVREALET